MQKRRAIIVIGALLAAGIVAWWRNANPLPDVEDGDYPMRLVSTAEKSELADIRGLFHFVVSEAQKGEIQIGCRRYQAVMASPGVLPNRYGTPSTMLRLTSMVRRARQEHWWGENSLPSFWLVDGRFYAISTTPSGNTLMVRRYKGDLGTIRVGRGNRKIGKVAMWGSLLSAERSVPVGDVSYGSGCPAPTEQCQLPVGEYSPQLLQMRFGRLGFALSNNYHADGKFNGALQARSVYSIRIDKNQPFVLDFSNRPEVIFVSPAKDRSFKPGEDVKVNAVLVDPVLNTMIRRLNDASREDVLLEPTDTITDSLGKMVAQGTMPFG